eukprot:10766164-Karenia_brevis.AAC.1
MGSSGRVPELGVTHSTEELLSRADVLADRLLHGRGNEQGDVRGVLAPPVRSGFMSKLEVM